MASASRTANQRTANSEQCIWCAGLSCLSRSSNHTNETDQRNQMNQISATRRKVQNVPIFSTAAPHTSSCAEFHEFVASWKGGRILTCKYIRIAHIASHLSFSTEGTMRTHSQPPTTLQTVDRRMLGVLKKKGAQSMEGISTLMGIGWAQVFMSVDRLSRIGKVSLTPVRPCEYRISIGGLLRR